MDKGKYIEIWKKAGFNPVPLEWTDALTALKTDVSLFFWHATVLREALRRGGYRVTTAASAEEAIAIHHPRGTGHEVQGAVAVEVSRLFISTQRMNVSTSSSRWL